MNDAVSMTIWLTAPMMATVCFVLSLVRSQQRSRMRRILGAGCIALAVAIGMLVMPFAWVLRDGLAPGMVASEGGSAITHFIMIYLVALIPVGALALAAWTLLRTPHSKEIRLT